MAKSKTDHVILRNNAMFCSHCGRSQAIPFPVEIPVFSAMTKAFSKSHKDCEKTWTEPMADQSKSKGTRALFWVQNGEHGMSSECIYAHLSGDFQTFGAKTNHPCDPDDFKRCYKLLEMVPEWNGLLDVLRPLSPVWNNLVDNWPKLTELYKEQMITKKDNGMYDLMKSLGC